MHLYHQSIIDMARFKVRLLFFFLVENQFLWFSQFSISNSNDLLYILMYLQDGRKNDVKDCDVVAEILVVIMESQWFSMVLSGS